jgi:hypothetical protein
MPTYRVLKQLDRGGRIIPRDSRSRLNGLPPEAIKALEQVGAIREISSPPLATLAGWKSRAGRLAKIGIETAEQFLEGDAGAIVKCLRVKPPTLERWRAQIREWSEFDGPTGPGR